MVGCWPSYKQLVSKRCTTLIQVAFGMMPASPPQVLPALRRADYQLYHSGTRYNKHFRHGNHASDARRSIAQLAAFVLTDCGTHNSPSAARAVAALCMSKPCSRIRGEICSNVSHAFNSFRVSVFTQTLLFCFSKMPCPYAVNVGWSVVPPRAPVCAPSAPASTNVVNLGPSPCCWVP